MTTASKNSKQNKTTRNKPGETTKTIDSFSYDLRGIKAGDLVTIIYKGKKVTGRIIILKEHLEPGGRAKNVGDQVAIIDVPGNKRVARFPHEIF